MIIAGVGSRKTPAPIRKQMTEIGKLVRKHKQFIRSGHAPGADLAFERGAKERTIVYLPWASFGGKHHAPERNYIDYEKTSERSQEIAQGNIMEFHPGNYERMKQSSKKLLGRSSYIVSGVDGDSPVRCVICWAVPEDAKKPYGDVQGGTGHPIRLARALGIPTFNLYTVPYEEVVDWLLMVFKQEAGEES